MVCPPNLRGALVPVFLATSAALAEGPTSVRRESRVDFESDRAFQADGGVQIFFDVVGVEASPDNDERVQAFRVMDRAERWRQLDEPVHVGLTRLSYELERDISFFSSKRLLDLSWVQAVAPDMNVTARPDGGFSVGVAPTNDFRLTFFDTDAAAPDVAKLARSRGAPVLVQENEGFSRVMGWRTAAWSSTWTFHEALGPGRTRITVLSLSYLYNVPPFFLGGEARLYRETVERSVALIGRLRTLSP